MMNAMNEEYEVCCRNPFRRLWRRVMSVRYHIMKMESDAKEERLHAGMHELFEAKKRYDSDSERVRLLKVMICNLELRIGELSDKVSSGVLVTDSDEMSRLKAMLRRRSSECVRLEERIKEDYETIAELLNGNAKETFRMPGRRHFTGFAAAMF